MSHFCNSTHMYLYTIIPMKCSVTFLNLAATFVLCMFDYFSISCLANVFSSAYKVFIEIHKYFSLQPYLFFHICDPLCILIWQTFIFTNFYNVVVNYINKYFTFGSHICSFISLII